VLLVSHNLAAVGALTHRALLLDSGRIVVDGLTQDAISAYIAKGSNTATYVRSPSKQTSSPHISRTEIVTSDGSGIHRFGEPLEVKISIKHQRPMAKACLAVFIVNQFQQSVAFAWAFYPEYKFGNQHGESVLVCRFPSLRLNVGQYYLRIFLTEAPPDEIAYERLDGICRFEVIRTDKTIPWGWNADDCTYHEDWQWTVTPADNTEVERQRQVVGYPGHSSPRRD